MSVKSVIVHINSDEWEEEERRRGGVLVYMAVRLTYTVIHVRVLFPCTSIYILPDLHSIIFNIFPPNFSSVVIIIPEKYGRIFIYAETREWHLEN